MGKLLKESRLLRFLWNLTEQVADFDESLDRFLGVFDEVRIESTKKPAYKYLHSTQ
jgi:hypothetical protein